ncbi:hypothetical protein NUACC26_071560 [Scytonema sp. NUACC26]
MLPGAILVSPQKVASISETPVELNQRDNNRFGKTNFLHTFATRSRGYTSKTHLCGFQNLDSLLVRVGGLCLYNSEFYSPKTFKTSSQVNKPMQALSQLFRIVKNGKYGFIDKTGKVVIEPQFDLAWNFVEDLAQIKVGDKYGYIDRTGKQVILPKFQLAYTFSNGLALVAIDYKYGYINPSGQIVIPPQFSGALAFKNGLAAVEINDKWGYIDFTGKTVIKPQFETALHFNQGLAAIQSEGK